MICQTVIFMSTLAHRGANGSLAKKKMRILILLFAGFCLGAHAAEPARIGMRASIEVGPDFKKDPYSSEEGKKWTVSGKYPAKGIQLWICAYGYISEPDLLQTIPGFDFEEYRKTEESAEELIEKQARCKTVGEYFLQVIVPKEAKKTRLDWSDRYEYWEDNRVTVWFFRPSLKDDLYGWCYETMQINTGDSSTGELKDEIRRLIDSARPWNY